MLSEFSSQARETRVGKSSSGSEFEVDRRSDLFKQSWTQEAVLRYFQKRLGRTG